LQETTSKGLTDGTRGSSSSSSFCLFLSSPHSPAGVVDLDKQSIEQIELLHSCENERTNAIMIYKL
jgi:hypothetical protein